MTATHDVDAIIASDPQAVITVLNEQFGGRTARHMRALGIDDILQIIGEAITGSPDTQAYVSSLSWRTIAQQISSQAAELPDHAFFGTISHGGAPEENVSMGQAKAMRAAIQAGKSTFVYRGVTYAITSPDQ